MSQFPPRSPDLVAAIAEVLDAVLDDAAPERRHQVRVAANLARIVERELRLGDRPDPDPLPADPDARWSALVTSTRADLEIAKPGYTAWEHG